ncbi:hypothetical protein [Arthrobacter sp. SDTb3-6]|uniref:DUF7426 family protein n=1 Tax=Arthrobacter sp. SDTb3-6 TaxID=2713571 RepID=UPI00159D8E78|nr:hypothetical protein [Arthrobacter sp. SDTb3-6]NVM97688.1 hypothetical protein [Arthrobacter sp. SDTb3-6]
MAFRPLEEVQGPITLPIKGKEYTLPAVSFEDGVRLRALISGESEDATWRDLFDILLGDVYQQLQDDKAGVTVIDRVFFTALADFQTGREGAEKLWENGVPQELVALLQKSVGQVQAAAAGKAGK